MPRSSRSRAALAVPAPTAPTYPPARVPSTALAITAPTSCAAAPLPSDLHAAIVARFEADPGCVAIGAAIFDGRAKAKPGSPYVTFKVPTGSTAFSSSTSHWSDRRIRFDCTAASDVAAEATCQAVHDAFDKASLSFRTGITSILIQSDRADAAPGGRMSENKRPYTASVTFQARVRTGRPDGGD